MRDLVLIGGGAHARVVAEAARAMRTFRLIGFVDPDPAADATTLGLPHLGDDTVLGAYPDADLCLAFGAVGSDDRRMRVAVRLTREGRRFAVVVHPSAIVSPAAVVECGAFIGAGAIVQCGARVGAHVVVNSGAIVEHDVRLAAHVQLAPRAVVGGGVQVGDGTFIGLGAAVRDHVRLGRGVTIGMGAVVVRDVPDGATAVGVPARLVAQHSTRREARSA